MLFRSIVQALGQEPAGVAAPQVVICPPFPLLLGVHQLLGETHNPALGAQNFHQKESGAYTGEVSVKQLQSQLAAACKQPALASLQTALLVQLSAGKV